MYRTDNTTPKLRFPGFTGDWQAHSLGTFLSTSKTKNEDLEFDKSQVLSVAAEAGVVNQIKYHGRSYAGVSVRPYNVLRKGEMVYTKSPLKAYPYGIIKFNESEDGIVSTLYAVYCVNKNTSGRFLDYYFYHPSRINKYLKPLVNIGAKNDMKVNNDIVLNGLVRLPGFDEQKKIADFLVAVDERIELQEKKVELLKKYKKGVMQKIFSQKIRFKDENGNNYPDWDEKNLGALLDYEQPTKYIVKSTEYEDSYKVPVLTAGKTFILGYTNETNGVFDNSLPVIIFDDFTTASHFVDFPFKVKSSAIKILKPKPGINLKVVYELLNQIKFVADDHKRYWISTFQNFIVSIPSPEEQQKIADFLSSLDDKIGLEKKKLHQAKLFKKSLLQRMFV